MVYRFQLKQNPRTLLLPLIAIVLVGGSIAVTVLVQPLVGVVALAISGYVGYHLMKYYMYAVNSLVRTSDDGLVCVTSTGTEVRIAWDEITHAGWFQSDDSRLVFVYAEGDDKLVSLPEHYDHLEDLVEEISEHTTIRKVTGEPREEIADALKREFFPDAKSPAEDESHPGTAD